MEWLTHPSEASALHLALENGDVEATRRSMVAMLEAGDMQAIQDAMTVAEETSDEVADEFQGLVEEEAQRVWLDGWEVSLFACPAIITVPDGAELPKHHLAEMLRSMAVPGERFIIAGGWVHAADLASLPLTKFRLLAKAFGRAALQGVEVVALDEDDFPNFPADPACSFRAAECFSPGSAPSRSAARLLMGAILTPPGGKRPGGLYDVLIADRSGSDGTYPLQDVLSEAGGPFTAALLPDSPISAVRWAIGAVECTAFEMRLRGAGMVAGVAPVAHLCLDGRDLHFVLALESGAILDAGMIWIGGLPGETIYEVAQSGASRIVEHRSIASMPKVPEFSHH